MRYLAVTLLLCITSVSSLASPRYWGSLEPGRYAAGFAVAAATSAAGAAGSPLRPVTVAYWYPAERSSAAPLTFRDYFVLAADLRRRSAPAGVSPDDLQKTLSAAITGDAAAIDAAKTEAMLLSKMYAVRDSRPREGRFPIVLFSARYGSVAAQAVLAEYLASRGYVVAAVWPKDAKEKLPFEVTAVEEKLEELDAQSEDLRGALVHLRALPFAGSDRTALIAWSYAGESAWRLAQSDARIDLVLGLDSNVRTRWAYQPATAMQSITHLPLHVRFADFEKGSAEFEGLKHGTFNALEGMIPAIEGIERVQPWSQAGEAARQGYERIAQRTLALLDETFAQPRRQRWEPVELRARDGARIDAELYRSPSGSGRCITLFHQSGSSRGEYRTIGPELARLGHTALAVDVRWGQRDFWNDVVNENAARHGTAAAREKRDTERVAAIKAGEKLDLDAAVDWLRGSGCAGPVIAWGASIQANGVLDLAVRRPDDVAAVVTVSPGEYAKDEPERMKKLVPAVLQPTLVLWGRSEDELSRPVHDAIGSKNKYVHPSTGRHGNAIFFEDPSAWKALRDFLSAHGKPGVDRVPSPAPADR